MQYYGVLLLLLLLIDNAPLVTDTTDFPGPRPTESGYDYLSWSLLLLLTKIGPSDFFPRVETS